jgi:hypothetical protein
MMAVLRIRIQDPGSGIRCLFDPWIRDPGWVKKDPGSGINNPENISKSLETIFWVKILKLFDPDGKNSDPGSGKEKSRIRDKKKSRIRNTGWWYPF